jgi:hypothetical protein
MKVRYILALAAVAALLLPEMAMAQRAGSIELGGVANFTIYDDEIGIENAPGIGGRAGLYLLPNLSAEVDWTYAEPDLSDPPGYQGRTQVVHELIQARLLYNWWVGENAALLLGGGYTYDNYSTPRRLAARGGGPGGLVGLRFRFSERFSARLEGFGYYVSEDDATVGIARPETFNMGAQAGLSVMLRDRTRTEIVELPAPPPDTVVVEREVEPDLPEGTPTQICLATGENVTVYITPQGDTLVGPRRVSVQQLGPGVAFAGEYAEGRSWFVNDEPVEFEDIEYLRSGGEISLDCANIMQVGEFGGVPLFADAGAERPFETLYVPVRPGVWQAYQTDLALVRGQQ